ncbi:MAG: hypothetical protein CMH62_01290 [Nanoarchaeota archaeon]|nr:hypothetical protein [Nanoarchaeota archaeon]|tara:strand:+ start:2157 stop:2372 length:216 start_codon:yes stop_codon:yes gene_type:complete
MVRSEQPGFELTRGHLNDRLEKEDLDNVTFHAINGDIYCQVDGKDYKLADNPELIGTLKITAGSYLRLFGK